MNGHKRSYTNNLALAVIFAVLAVAATVLGLWPQAAVVAAASVGLFVTYLCRPRHATD